MKKWSNSLLLILFSILLILTGCNQNAADLPEAGERGENTPSIQQVGYGNIHSNQSARSLTVPTDGVQKINNGFITIDQNSYSTTLSSDKFPHSKYVQQGQFRFYKEKRHFTEGKNPQTKKRQEIAQNPAPKQQPKAEQPKQQEPQQAPAQETDPEQKTTTQGITAVESKVIELTNAQRRKNGLTDLQADTQLSNVAREKSNDMQNNNYFSHTSPTYGSPFDMMRDFGVTYKSAGENIAQGQPTPEQVVDAWMNSEGHRKNILSGDYTHIGVGYAKTGNYWTQMFIRK